MVHDFGREESALHNSTEVAAMSVAARTGWLMRHFSLRARKSLGQNFLTDANHVGRIVQAAVSSGPRAVIEIGGGLGALTVPLAQSGVDLTVYELDRGLAEALEFLTRDFDNTCVLNLDVLGEGLHGGGDVVAVGNLPYYITTPILERLFEATPAFRELVVTVQREVGDRIQAQPGSKTYGSLTLWCKFYTERVELISRIPASAFTPRPTVDSIALKMVLRREPPPEIRDPAAFFSGVRAALGQRRKTLFNCLRHSSALSLNEEAARCLLEAAGIDGGRRGETLSFDEFVQLGNLLADNAGAVKPND